MSGKPTVTVPVSEVTNPGVPVFPQASATATWDPGDVP